MSSHFWSDAEITASRVGEERPKTWEEITDDEIVEAVAFAAKRDRSGVARGGHHVLSALAQPNPEQWPDAGPNGLYGLGLIPRFGEGSASTAKVSARLRRLAREGRLERVEMVTSRGNPAPPAYQVRKLT